MRLRKTELAERDLENIYRFGYERFGIDQAEHYADSLLNVFELIALNPMMARLHAEYQRPVRMLSHRQNLFVIL
jgi:toxin ParE1/3/4